LATAKVSLKLCVGQIEHLVAAAVQNRADHVEAEAFSLGERY
jgi:hypothetical protein